MLGDVSVMGGRTTSKILYGPEAHKLMLSFDLNPDPAAPLVHQGQPVSLGVSTYSAVDYDTVVPAAHDAAEADVIGISIHEQDSAYKGSIVVATRGYAVVLCQLGNADCAIGAKLAIGNGEADVADQEVYDSTSGYCLVHEIEATGEGELHYGWALESGSVGDLIKVLVKN